MQKCLELDMWQSRSASHMWKVTADALAELKTKQADILSRLSLHADVAESQTNRMQAGPRTTWLLGRVAELSENALLQQEVVRSASRTFVWHICSPDNLARLMQIMWPTFPPLLYSLQAAAAA